MIPTTGAIVAWQRMKDGKEQWQGHIGVVSKVVSDTDFYSIEGNASNSGSSNGDGVYEVHRHVKKDVHDGLKVIGFIQIA
jgi:surface antigen